MKIRTILCFVVVLGLSFCTKAVDLPPKTQPGKDAAAAEKQYEKELDEIRKEVKGELKIKLKKDVKGGYGWEITGKDAQEVLKANDTLKKRLGE